MVGRTYLVHSELKKGDEKGAQKTIASALRRLEKYPHPGLAWRLHVSTEKSSACSGRLLEAAGSLRQGLDAFLLNLGERLARRQRRATKLLLCLPSQ